MSTTPMSVENNNNNNNGIVDNSKAVVPQSPQLQQQQPQNKAYGPYKIFYAINEMDKTKFEITFVEDNNTRDFKPDKANLESTPSFMCLCPPGKGMDIVDFKSILIGSGAIRRIKGLPSAEQDSAVIKTEKEITGFTDSKGKIGQANLFKKRNIKDGV